MDDETEAPVDALDSDEASDENEEDTLGDAANTMRRCM